MAEELVYLREELPTVTKLSVSTIEEEIRNDRFPKARQLSGRRVGWLVREIREWLEARPVSDQLPPANTGAKKPRPAAGPGARAAHQGG